MLAAIAFGVRGAPIRVPRLGFQAAQALIGCLVAHAVNASIAATLLEDGFLILAVVGVTVVAASMTGWVLTRIRLLPGTSAAWGSSPGGASAMVAMAEEFGADPRLVAFMQYVRVACVALTASLVARFLAGGSAAPPGAGWIRRRSRSSPPWRSPTRRVAGPAPAHPGRRDDRPLSSARRSTPPGSPNWPCPPGSCARLCGDRLDGGPALHPRHRAGDVVRPAGRAGGDLRADRALRPLGLRLTFLLPIDLLTAYLATSPGGLDSVAIIAIGTHSDVSFVLAVQTLRLLVVIVTGPMVAKWISRSAGQAR